MSDAKPATAKRRRKRKDAPACEPAPPPKEIIEADYRTDIEKWAESQDLGDWQQRVAQYDAKHGITRKSRKPKEPS